MYMYGPSMCTCTNTCTYTCTTVYVYMTCTCTYNYVLQLWAQTVTNYLLLISRCLHPYHLLHHLVALLQN